MGNGLGINLTIIPCDHLIAVCFPRRKTVDGLQNNWSRLKAERDYILRTIAKSVEMSAEEHVKQWLQQVVIVELQVEKLLAKESTNKCFCAYCPINCKKRYSFWKKFAPLDQEVRDLLKHVPDILVQLPQRIPTEPTTGMESMLHEVWRYVENQQHPVGLIGLYGMGGVGKTTLLKAVHNKLCSSTQIFDLQLWIVVSKSPNLDNIQNYIGEKIGFHNKDWKIKSQQKKARDISNLFCEKMYTYILLLDDVWKRFDLTKVGIPPPSPENKSKIIFTTRSKQVCGEMRATHIQVRCLKDEEAWNLFKENVGEDALNAHHDIPGLAKEVMKECSGLPLKLIVIGRAMTYAETIHDWKHAIQVLKCYTADFSTITDEVFTPLKFSYDNLTNEVIRSCFLYCSLYAEGEEILKSDLVDKWICEDYLGRFGDLDKDRNEGYSYINTLVHASLLEECPGGEKVKMHDVIRDMALWIGGDGLYVQARAGLTEIPDDVKWEHVEKLSLMNNSVGELNVPTESIDLKTLLLCRGGLKSFNNDFFNLVPYLKVLDLSYNDKLTTLPKEFFELVFLQYLNLEGTRIKELPNGFKKLVKLKYLNVLHTQVQTISEGVLLSMKELSVFRCGSNQYFYYANFLGENLVKEFEGSKYLQDVAIPAASEIHISNLTSSVKLLNVITELTLTSFSDSTSLDILFLKEMKHLLCLNIENLQRVEKIVVGEEQGVAEISTFDIQNGLIINSTLRSLRLYGCLKLKNLSWVVFFPNIKSIEVASCWEMQTLVSENNYGVDYELEQPFAKLQTLELSWIGKLESIYFTTLSFPCLNTLSVGKGCDSLKKLPFNSSSCDQGRGLTIKGFNKWWNELQWEDEATQSTFSSNFKSIDG